MEMLSNETGGFGQSYGYIVYTTEIPNIEGELIVTGAHDRLLVLLDGKLVSPLDQHPQEKYALIVSISLQIAVLCE